MSVDKEIDELHDKIADLERGLLGLRITYDILLLQSATATIGGYNRPLQESIETMQSFQKLGKQLADGYSASSALYGQVATALSRAED